MEKVDIRNSSNFSEKEDLSVSDWIALQGLWDYPHIPALASALTSSIVGREPDEIGAHYFFDYIKSGFGFESLLSEGQDGAQSLMIEEGEQSTCINSIPSIPKLNYTNNPIQHRHPIPRQIPSQRPPPRNPLPKHPRYPNPPNPHQHNPHHEIQPNAHRQKSHPSHHTPYPRRHNLHASPPLPANPPHRPHPPRHLRQNHPDLRLAMVATRRARWEIHIASGTHSV